MPPWVTRAISNSLAKRKRQVPVSQLNAVSAAAGLQDSRARLPGLGGVNALELGTVLSSRNVALVQTQFPLVD